LVPALTHRLPAVRSPLAHGFRPAGSPPAGFFMFRVATPMQSFDGAADTNPAGDPKIALIRFVAMPTDQARAYQRGAPDAYGNPPERRISDGSGIPCRHCLQHVAAGQDYLTLAYRPFPALQPYAETGPIFLHAA